MTRSVSGVTGSVNRSRTKVASVTAETALIDAALGCPTEGQPPVLQVVDRSHGFLCQNVGRLLIDQVIVPL